MQKSHNDNLKSNSSAKLTPIRPKLQFGGRRPTADLKPGDYLVKCVAAWTQSRGKETQAVWQFEIADGVYRGIALRKWMIIADASGLVSFSGLYASYCQVALGRPVTADDNPGDIGSLFSGKPFILVVRHLQSSR